MCSHRRLLYCTTQGIHDEETERDECEALDDAQQEETGQTKPCLHVARRGPGEQGWVKTEGDGALSHQANKSAQEDEMSCIFVLLLPKPQHDLPPVEWCGFD